MDDQDIEAFINPGKLLHRLWKERQLRQRSRPAYLFRLQRAPTSRKTLSPPTNQKHIAVTATPPIEAKMPDQGPPLNMPTAFSNQKIFSVSPTEEVPSNAKTQMSLDFDVKCPGAFPDGVLPVFKLVTFSNPLRDINWRSYFVVPYARPIFPNDGTFLDTSERSRLWRFFFWLDTMAVAEQKKPWWTRAVFHLSLEGARVKEWYRNHPIWTARDGFFTSRWMWMVLWLLYICWIISPLLPAKKDFGNGATWWAANDLKTQRWYPQHIPAARSFPVDKSTDYTIPIDIPTKSSNPVDSSAESSIAIDLPTQFPLSVNIPTKNSIPIDMPTEFSSPVDIPIDFSIPIDIATASSSAPEHSERIWRNSDGEELRFCEHCRQWHNDDVLADVVDDDDRNLLMYMSYEHDLFGNEMSV